MRIVISLAAAALVAASSPASAGWFGSCDHKAPRKISAPSTGITKITVIGRAGSLRVTGRARATEVQASGTACSSDADLLKKIDLVATRNGSELRVEAVIPEHLTFGSSDAALDFEVTLPDGVPVIVRDGSGDTVIENTGSLDVDDGSGGLEIRNVHGDLVVVDGSGGMRIADVTGNVRITDGSGSIEVDRVGGSVTIPSDGSGSAVIRNVKGNVVVEAKGSGRLEVSDVGGNFAVHHKGSGGIDYSRVAGKVDIPERYRRQ